jgi:hypothetical protein
MQHQYEPERVLPGGNAPKPKAPIAQASPTFDSQHARLSQRQLAWKAQNDSVLRTGAVNAMRDFYRRFKDAPVAGQVILAITRTLAKEKEPIQ